MPTANDKLAKRLWAKVFYELYGRGEFDWWWDGLKKMSRLK